PTRPTSIFTLSLHDALPISLQEHTGVHRPAKDLDIFLTSETASRALVVLTELGFRCEVCDPVWLAKAYRDDYFVDFITGMRSTKDRKSTRLNSSHEWISYAV